MTELTASKKFEKKESPNSLNTDDWLRQLVIHLPQGILLSNSTRRIMFINQTLLDLFHLKINPEDLLGLPVASLYSLVANQLSDYKKAINRIEDLVSKSKPVYKDPLLLSDGRIIARDYIPVWKEGKFEGNMWIFYDETENMKAGYAIKEQKQFYEGILNNIPADIVVLTPDLQYLFANPTSIKDPEIRNWAIGKTDFEYCIKTGKDQKLIENRMRMFAEVLEKKTEKEWEEKLLNDPGEAEYYLRRLSPVLEPDDKIKLIIGYGLNITKLKKIEAQIKINEKRLKDFFNFSQAIICTHTLKGDLIEVNPAVCELTEFSEKEIVGKNLSDFLWDEDKEKLCDNYLVPISEGKRLKGLFRIKCKSGRKVYLLYQNYVVEEPGREPYIASFAQDVTERIEIEKQLKTAKKITEETAKIKERFLANMSHEIRTPMNGILGITHLLEKSKLDEEQKNYLRIIGESAETLLDIINDILDFEKIGTGNILLENIPFNLTEKIRSCISLFEPAASKKLLRINFHNQLNPYLIVMGDPTKLSQIINNLVNNAIKFTHSGSITVSTAIFEEMEKSITIQLVVEDTGIGIDKDKLTTIFHPFTQAYPETTRLYGGSGLGLSITKKLIEIQNGLIEVESEPGHGTRFVVTLSYIKPVEVNKIKFQDDPINETKLEKIKILLAEDNPVNQLLIKTLLQQWGIESKLALNGNEVLEMLKKESFDLLLMDIQMPVMNGLETTLEIRADENENYKNIPIIALTANAIKGEEQKYLAAGMNAYLVKPFKEKDLYSAISFTMKHKNVLYMDESTDKLMHSENMQNEEILYDLDYLMNIQNPDDEFIQNIKKIFIETVPLSAQQLIEACEKKQWDEASRIAHKLKSSIDTFNVQSIKKDIRHIEKMGREKMDLETLLPAAVKIHTIVKTVIKQMKEG